MAFFSAFLPGEVFVFEKGVYELSSQKNSLKKDKFYMRKALDLAARGAGFVSPNPMVGAVVVKDGEIAGRGFHRKFGGRHAEINALEDARGNTKGAELYVNLEPCSHHGKTPPCSDAILNSGIERVIVANEDPNPLVGGRGIEKLQNQGLEVKIGVLAEEGRKLNEAFFVYMQKNRPFFVQKTAQTLDGYLAAPGGDSRWITGEKARARGHRLRHELDAVLIGRNTLIKDDPRLTARKISGEVKQPLRIIMAGKGEIPGEATLFHTDFGREIVIFVERERSQDLNKKFSDINNVKVIPLSVNDRNEISPLDIAEKLFEMEIQSVLIEGGGRVNHTFLKSGLIDKYFVFLAPKLLGGNDGVACFSGEAVSAIDETEKLVIDDIERLERDILITAYPRNDS